MTIKSKQEAQNPLILRSHRIMEAFAKSNDERDFYLDRLEGFLIYVDLDKTQEELDKLEEELKTNKERYCMVPKLTFYETKKIMEGFVNEKVYDIDTKEKLINIIQSKEARENFLEFIFDHHLEFEKWQQFYQERSRIRIIEWLRQNHFHFVFEEDLDFPKALIEKIKKHLFEVKVSNKEIVDARKALSIKAKTYYSNEALNPRPKRGRPPKQIIKLEVEPQSSTDIFLTISPIVRPFLFVPDITSSSGITFSAKFEDEGDLLVNRRNLLTQTQDPTAIELNQKLNLLRGLSSRWMENEPLDDEFHEEVEIEDDAFDDDEDEDDDDNLSWPPLKKTAAKAKVAKEKSPSKPASTKKSATAAKTPAKKTTKPSTKKPAKATKTAKTAKAPTESKSKKTGFRSIVKSKKAEEKGTSKAKK